MTSDLLAIRRGSADAHGSPPSDLSNARMIVLDNASAGCMSVRFGPWLGFHEAYRHHPNRPRSGMFEPMTRALTAPVAGLYLIADDRLGRLGEPACVIYLGCTVGRATPSSFHDRLWKHCCKAIGQSGDGQEPKKTRRWEEYHVRMGEDSRCFAHWHFSLAAVTVPDLGSGKPWVHDLERTALEEYGRLTGGLPRCNGQKPKRPAGSFEIFFPWTAPKARS